MQRWAFRRGLCVAIVAAAGIAVGAGASVARAAELTAAEKQHFDLAKKYQAQLQTNLKLARDAAGPGEDTPPASKAKLAAARLQTARQSAANVAARLEKLPADNDDVKALQSEYDETMKAVDALNDRITRKNAKPKGEEAKAPPAKSDGPPAADTTEKALAPVAKKPTKQVDASSYPELKADLERLKELRETVTVGSLQDNRPAVAEIVKQLPAMKDEAARILKKYEPLLSQKSRESGNLKASAQQLDYFTKAMEVALEKEKQALPKQIDDDLDRVTKLTEQAIQESKPAFFTGGIAGTLEQAEDKLVLYQALDPDGGKAAAEKLAKAREAVKQGQQSLAGAIIEANELPPDRYAGADKADLAKRAAEALKKQRPKVEVLAVRFPSDKWNRETKLRYENREWRKIDRSRLQAQVIVKRDDKIAEVHPINLWTDHTNNDAITAIPLYAEKEEIEPQSLLLVAKVK